VLRPSVAEAALADQLPGETRRARRVRGPLLLAGGVAAASVALHLRDPHDAGSWGVCPLYALTGHYCPGCGGLRAVNDLTNGDVLGAASSNLLFVLSIPLLAFLWVRWFRGRWKGEPTTPEVGNPYVLSAVAIALLAIFSVARNLPFGSWLAP